MSVSRNKKELVTRAKTFLKDYIIVTTCVLFITCAATYFVVAYKVINLLTIFAVIYSFCWLIKLFFQIYKIIIDIHQKNICSHVDRVLVILEKYYEGTIIKNKKYYAIHFDNCDHGKTIFKYNGYIDHFKEDDIVEFSYLGRCKILIDINRKLI